ncbi:MAG: cell surface protein SprA [Saprospiraceae bacterium]
MKKRFLLTGYAIVFGLVAWNLELRAGTNFPENPFAPEYVLATGVSDLAASAVVPPLAFVQTTQDTIPLNDRQGDFLNNPSPNPFDLKDPASVEQNVEYDPETGQYIITERIGDDYFRPPTYMTFDEYMEYRAKQQEKEYFDQLSGLGSGLGSTGRPDPIAKVDVKNKMLDRLFGGTEVDIKPQGNIDLTFGVDYSKVQNPSFTERQQRQGGFDFDMAIQMNVEGSIGKKLRLSTNYNTQATFDFDNTMKLDYNTDAFGEDDIIKKIEAGNVSLPLRGTLIQGSQSLFGIKMETQWGRLRLTGVASQQKSEREEITLQGGSQFQDFMVNADEYDENRHFFLTHYNRNNFEEALSELPQIKTLFTIEKIQVWVTDPRYSTENIRDIVAIADLGETDSFTNQTLELKVHPREFRDLDNELLPDNYGNAIYDMILDEPRTREVDRVVNTLKTPPFNLQQGRDFEKVTARQLSPTEFTYHPNLGYISLNVNIQPDQVVGVAFEYSYGDSVYQVGQLAEDVPQNTDTITQNVLFVKMLKATIQPVDLPTWDLMMKNIYNIGAYNVAREDFKLDIFYDDPGEAKKRFLPVTNLAGQPLLRVFNLDRLNVQNDPQPDGVFDFVEGVTINTRNGRIIFPKLEPFGRGLTDTMDNPADKIKFGFPQLYSKTLFNAREDAEQNRFTIEGSYKSSVSSEISLGAFNIPPGSVTVSAGGQLLVEGRDYEVDYNIGRVRILNDAILNAGVPIKVGFEDNTLFGFQTKTMLGLRADYTVNKHLTIGGTYLHLFERPFTQKVNIGDDPINNQIFGLDLNYSNEAPWLTKLVDKLPLYSTKAPSTITFSAETAALKPGHARAINENSDEDSDKGGVIYIDDFEGSVSSLDLRTPYIGSNGWVIASVPRNDDENNNPMFPEANGGGTLPGVNRGRLSWYRIDPTFNGGDNNPYTISISQTEIFPNYTPTQQFTDNRVPIFDIQYDPTQRGPYNFDPVGGTQYSAGLNELTGSLNESGKRWGGIMRSMNTNDFQSANIEFVEFWMLSPYLNPSGDGSGNPDASNGAMDGNIYMEFGNISEDILPDSRKFFENGLPGPNTQGRRATNTVWGRVPLGQQITNAFDVDPENRRAQDVGLDGLPDSLEQTNYADYLTSVQNIQDPATRQAIINDPSNDNFKHYRDYPDGTTVLERYSRFYGTEGNTPENNNSQFVTSSTQVPDAEDLDGDRTLNETESYFQYKIPIQFDGTNGIADNPFITDVLPVNNGQRVWYRFRVPLNLLDGDPNFKKVGGIRDFRSIRFMRMYFKDFEKPINFRFATLELVRNQWRRYSQDIEENNTCIAASVQNTAFDVNAVNIEENSQRTPFNYVLPPGISREQALGVNLNALQNEQALSLRVCDLQDGDSKGIFKNLNLDMRVFSKMKMFVHAERADCGGAGLEDVKDNDMSVFIRIGSDFKNNFYEYELPLKISDENSGIPFNDDRFQRVVWPKENEISIDFDLLKQMKIDRNSPNGGGAIGDVWPEGGYTDPNNPNAKLRIRGNPNLGLVKSIMIGVRNPLDNEDCTGREKSIEIWVNELRVFGLDERGGVAGTARLDMQIADLAGLSLSTKATSIGYGALDQQLAERQRESITQYDIATNVQLDKFLPEKLGLRIPFYFQYSNETRTPQFDPYDLDIELKDKLNDNDLSSSQRDSIKRNAQYVTTIKSYNFTNVRKERTNTQAKPMPWDISNFSLTYAFDETNRRDPVIESDRVTRRRGALDYTYTRQVKYIEPFKKVIKNDKYLKFIKELNLNPLPNSFSFSTDLDRRFNTTSYRFTDGLDPIYTTYYNKQFLWNRNYDLQWDIARNLKFQFNADNRSVIDEPDETKLAERSKRDSNDPWYVADVNQTRRDSIWSNIKRFGRPKGYQHSMNLTYTVPLKNFPFLDWVNLKASYRANYAWDAASLSPSAQRLGNIIRNGQSRQINGDLDFEKLYNYSGFLKKINSKPRPDRGGNQRGNNPNDRSGRGGKDSKDSAPDAGADKDKKDAKDKKKGDGEPGKLTRALIRPLMAIRKARATYQEDYSTVVPGYLNDSEILGMNNFDSPGWDFIAGWQPNIKQQDYYTSKDWLYSNWTWITGDQLLNQPVTQNYSQTLDLKVTVEPLPDLRIDIEGNRNKTENHSEFFRRDTIFNTEEERFQEEWKHLIPKQFGSYTMSYMAINTLFNDDLTGLFNEFSGNRVIIARRLGTGTHEDPIQAAQGYPQGYGRSQQNVVIPAFIAAYTGQDPNTIKISDNYINDIVIKSIPRPNWRLTYNLSKLKPLSDIFQSFTINHGYKGTLTVNSFNTNLQYSFEAPTSNRNQSTLDYYTRVEVPDLVIQESFSPLIGADMRLKNDISLKAEYKTSRTLRLEMIASRLHETKGTELTIGAGYKLKEVKFAFLAPKKKKKAKPKKDAPPSTNRPGARAGQNNAGDLDITFDFSLRDDITTIHELETDLEEPSRGNRTLSILPQATYQLNKQLSIRLFFDYRRNVPKTSQGFPTTNIRSGVTIRFTL